MTLVARYRHNPASLHHDNLIVVISATAEEVVSVHAGAFPDRDKEEHRGEEGEHSAHAYQDVEQSADCQIQQEVDHAHNPTASQSLSAKSPTYRTQRRTVVLAPPAPIPPLLGSERKATI